MLNLALWCRSIEFFSSQNCDQRVQFSNHFRYTKNIPPLTMTESTSDRPVHLSSTMRLGQNIFNVKWRKEVGLQKASVNIREFKSPWLSHFFMKKKKTLVGVCSMLKMRSSCAKCSKMGRFDTVFYRTIINYDILHVAPFSLQFFMCNIMITSSIVKFMPGFLFTFTDFWPKPKTTVFGNLKILAN